MCVHLLPPADGARRSQEAPLLPASEAAASQPAPTPYLLACDRPRLQGTMHCVFHNGINSYHAYSAEGVHWTTPSTPMFSTALALNNTTAALTPFPSDAGTASATGSLASCTSAEDCSLLGTCESGRCKCSAGYTGPSCGQLDLQPVSSLQAATLWPQAGVSNSSAWGFTVAYDPADKLYHAVADVSCGCAEHSSVRSCTEYTGVLASGGYASSLVHLQSSRPDGGTYDYPYAFRIHNNRLPTKTS